MVLVFSFDFSDDDMVVVVVLDDDDALLNALRCDLVKVVRDPDDDDTKKERRPEEEKNKFESAAFPECRIRAMRVDTQKELEEEKRHLRPSLSLVRRIRIYISLSTQKNQTRLLYDDDDGSPTKGSAKRA